MMISESLVQNIFEKASLKKQVYNRTTEAFKLFMSSTQKIAEELSKEAKKREQTTAFEFKSKGSNEFELRFACDVLIFAMHTNIFEFSRDHEVMKTSYIKEDKNRSYCGVINIYNFLSDSFKYNRENDLGYLIGRIFINSENHYFVEGKKEIGLLYNNFNSTEITPESVNKIIESAISYTINFDLLAPPYDTVKVVSVSEMIASLDSSTLATGKRLGFRFQADTE